MQLTLTETAELFGRHRATIHRHVEAGRLSCTVRGDGRRVIDLSEAIRVYGEPGRLPEEVQQIATAQDDQMQQAVLQTLQAMHAELVALRQEVAGLKEEQQRLLPPPSAAAEPLRQEEDPHGLRSLAKNLGR